MTYNENELIASIKQKSQDAFNKLYDRYSPALYSVILQIVRNEEIGTNVMYKVFMIIWRTIEDFDSTKTRLFTWMLQTARTAAIYETKLPHYNEILKQSIITGNGTLPELSPSEIDNSGLKKVIQNLTDEQKTVIDLYYFNGLSGIQIAKALSIPEDIIELRMRTSLSEIRILLRKRQ